jgi:hypothetical protein
MNKTVATILLLVSLVVAQNSLEGFVKPSKQLGGEFDFSTVTIELTNKQGYVKESTTCAPTGYYVIPVYDSGSYTLRVKGPKGWNFEPQSREVINTSNEMHDFELKGFEVQGTTVSINSNGETKNVEGPSGVTVALYKGEAEKQYVPLFTLFNHTEKL